MTKRTKLDKEWLEEQYVIRKKSMTEISREFNITLSKVNYWLVKFRLHNTKPEKFSPEWLFEQYVTLCKSPAEIEKETGSTASSINWQLKIYGIKRRPCSEALKIKWQQEEFRKKKTDKNHPCYGKKGAEANRWKKNKKTPLYKNIRTCHLYKEWREKIFQRDNWTCQICFKRGNGDINADHVYPLYKIMKDFNIEILEDAFLCEKLWDINNGRTLCVECHRKTETYGKNG